MIDSHVHLNHPDFGADFDEVIERARNAGVSRMVNIGFDLERLGLRQPHDDVVHRPGEHLREPVDIGTGRAKGTIVSGIAQPQLQPEDRLRPR